MKREKKREDNKYLLALPFALFRGFTLSRFSALTLPPRAVHPAIVFFTNV